MTISENDNKNILFLTHVGEPGGAEYIMLRLCESVKDQSKVAFFEDGPLGNYLNDMGVEHSIISMPKTLSSIRRQGLFTDVLKGIPALFSMIGKLIKISKDHSVIICMSQKSYVLSCLAKPFVRKPIIWFMNDLVSTDHFSKPMIFLMTKIFARFANKIIVNSRASYDAWGKSGGSTKHVEIIYPGTDYQTIQNHLSKTETIKKYREEFSPNNRPVIGIFGRICDWKGQDVFLKTIAAIENINGIIVGDAFFDQKDFEKKLHKIIQDKNLSDRVVFTGHLDDAPCAMAACDIIVHASTQPEPFGLVIVEAMMCGKPVIATNAGGAAEIIIHGQSGLLTKPKDSQELVKAINHYLDDKKKAVEIAKQGQLRAIEKFSNEQMIEQFKHLLKNIDAN